MKTLSYKTVSRLPASRFPAPAEVYFCDSCGRDLTKSLYHDRAPVWQPLRPMWCLCPCGRKYLSGAAEWDDLTTWERKQRVGQLWVGFVLFALLVTPVTLAYFAVRYGGAALLAVVGIALIPSVLAAKPLWFVLLDLYEIIVSMWRTSGIRRRISPAATIKQLRVRFGPHKLQLTPVAAVIAVLIIATRWIPAHLDAASITDASLSPERPNIARQETSFAPAKLRVSRIAQIAAPGAPSAAFKRVQVGPDEIDYVAEDVTVRHFLPTPPPRVHPAYKEVHVGPDVTMRYFARTPAVATPTRTAAVDPPLSLSQ